MLSSREEERDRLLKEIDCDPSQEVNIFPNPALLRRFEEKVAGIREALNDSGVRTEAAETTRSLSTA